MMTEIQVEEVNNQITQADALLALVEAAYAHTAVTMEPDDMFVAAMAIRTHLWTAQQLIRDAKAQ